ncbi:ATP-binding cassette domain-containing protein, partial [Nostocoides sp.]|uniref:ATP-binding cassette domain-containing protein n=1 Tax=Nostocoides sp. TaxID=1917966 RepID=UPI003BB02729
PAVAAAGEGDLPEESTAPAGLDSASAGDPASISWRRISAAWAADRPLALAPLDLDLPQGTHVSISGANGSGKSTALAVLARHLDPQSGRYDLGGRDALTLPLPTARGRIALVDDSPYLFASTVGANLRFAAPRPDQVCDGDLVAALQQAGLGAWYAALPDGLETRLGAGGRGISGGERARLALARAVLSRRPVILLDEPVAHLDAPTARAILADLLAASADRTLVMVSHREDGRDGFAHQIVLCPPVAAGGTRD